MEEQKEEQLSFRGPSDESVMWNSAQIGLRARCPGCGGLKSGRFPRFEEQRGGYAP
jgi:hypothetical protein